MKILLVEDNVKMRSFIKKIIEREIETVEEFYECEDGAEAVELYQQYHPDWVLMDIQLKTIDGLAATRMILNFDPSAKVIMVTQYDDTEYRDQARAIGVYGYILKDNLSQILSIILENTKNF